MSAKYGQFLVGIDIEENDPGCHDNVFTLLILIDTLAQLRPDDKTLAESVEHVRKQIIDSYGGELTQLSVEYTFQRARNGRNTTEVFKAWWDLYQRTREEKIRNLGLILGDDLEAETIGFYHFE